MRIDRESALFTYDAELAQRELEMLDHWRTAVVDYTLGREMPDQFSNLTRPIEEDPYPDYADAIVLATTKVIQPMIDTATRTDNRVDLHAPTNEEVQTYVGDRISFQAALILEQERAKRKDATMRRVFERVDFFNRDSVFNTFTHVYATSGLIGMAESTALRVFSIVETIGADCVHLAERASVVQRLEAGIHERIITPQLFAEALWVRNNLHKIPLNPEVATK